MPSFRSLFLAAAAASYVVAAKDYWIEPDTVDLTIRERWCDDQQQTCPYLCTQEGETTSVNTCDPETLTYGCLCSNDKQPDTDEYTQTLPFFVCREWGNQCVTACGTDNTCSSSCREDNICGATEPKAYNVTAAADLAAATGASSTEDDDVAIFSGRPGSGSDGDDKTGAAAGFGLGQACSLTMVLGGVLAGIALI